MLGLRANERVHKLIVVWTRHWLGAIFKSSCVVLSLVLPIRVHFCSESPSETVCLRKHGFCYSNGPTAWATRTAVTLKATHSSGGSLSL